MTIGAPVSSDLAAALRAYQAAFGHEVPSEIVDKYAGRCGPLMLEIRQAVALPLDLFTGFVTAQWMDERISKADIHQPAVVLPRNLHQQCEMVEIDPQPPLAVIDTGIEIRHFKTDLSQQPCEEAVQFVAEPSATVDDDLLPERPLIEADRTLQPDVQVFEGNMPHVGGL